MVEFEWYNSLTLVWRGCSNNLWCQLFLLTVVAVTVLAMEGVLRDMVFTNNSVLVIDTMDGLVNMF